MTEPDPIDHPATQFQDEGDEYVAWTPPVRPSCFHAPDLTCASCDGTLGDA